MNMKNMKKIISSILILVMGVMLTACGSSSPTSEVKKVLGDLSAGKRDEINVMVTDALNKSIFGGTEQLKDMPGGMTKETQETINIIAGKMEYKVNSETVNEDKATVNITLKGGNISKAFMSYLGDLLTLAYTSDVLATTPKEEYFLLANSIFNEKLQGIEYDERTIDINLTKHEDKWVIENDAAFYELLLGSSASKEPVSGK